MKRILKLTIGLLAVMSVTAGECADKKDMNLIPQQQYAPAEISEAMEEAAFTVSPIGAAVEARIKGLSYGAGCTTPLADLRYITVLHHDGHGHVRVGEMICHRTIAADLVDIFRALYKGGYPIERMELIDEYGADDERSMRANNTSCFNYRRVAGSKRMSKHATGMAVDINPLYNPYVRVRADGSRLVQPSTAVEWTDRSAESRYMIRRGDLCWREFTRRGFSWGGAWRRYKDYQHFEKK